MSRIGKKPIPIPQGVKVARGGRAPCAPRAPRASWRRRSRPDSATPRRRRHALDRARRRRPQRARAPRPDPRAGGQHGPRRQGRLRAEARDRRHRLPGQLQGKNLQLALGYSHPIIFPLPDGVRPRSTSRSRSPCAARTRPCSGQTAAKLRALRKPDPYKGKGIKYADEVHPAQGRQEGGREMLDHGSSKAPTGEAGTCRHPDAGARAPRSGRAWPCSAA